MSERHLHRPTEEAHERRARPEQAYERVGELRVGDKGMGHRANTYVVLPLECLDERVLRVEASGRTAQSISLQLERVPEPATAHSRTPVIRVC